MSLINDALKKAQRLRTEDPLAAPPMPGGARVAKRGEPRTAQQLLLIAAGVVALVVLTVVATVWLVNRPAAPKSAPAVTASPAQKIATDGGAPAPIIVAPVIKPTPMPGAAAPVPPPAAAAPAVAPNPAQRVSIPVPLAAQSTPVAASAVAPSAALFAASEASIAPVAESSPTAPPPPVAPPKADERIHVFVDAIRVTGIRSSGEESRVLMNDRVFRLNDIVDRTLGLRLTKVEPNTLTFTDANGASYVKNF
jgi:hypothetical protein